MSEIVKPIVHYAFSHLNKRVTVLGYPPVLGGLFLIASIMLLIFSIAFRSTLMGVFAVIFLPIFIMYTRKNMKAIKENRLEISTLYFFETKRKIYVDQDNVINQILNKND
jgi:hypothetical protein